MVVWTDIDSHITKPSFSCLRSASEWQKVWRVHKGCSSDDGLCPPTPDVDFDSYMVIALFNGPYAQDLGLSIDSVDNEKDAIRLRFERNVYAVGGEPMRPKTTYDYAFVVVPKSKKAIVIQERVLKERAEPPEKGVWRERARIEPAK